MEEFRENVISTVGRNDYSGRNDSFWGSFLNRLLILSQPLKAMKVVYCKACTLVLFLLCIAASFQIASADPVPPPPQQTVSQELASVMPTWTVPHHLVIYVDPGPKDPDQHLTGAVLAPPLGPMTFNKFTTPEDIASANGLSTCWFGGTLAVAPSTMTVLNTSSSLYDVPITNLVAVQPLPSLLGSLTQDQFNLLATTGLAMTDLDQDQQVLLRELIPDPLKIVPTSVEEPEMTDYEMNLTGAASDDFNARFAEQQKNYEQQVSDIPSDQILDQVRLHAYIQQLFNFTDSKGQHHNFFDDQSASTGSMKLAVEEGSYVQRSGSADLNLKGMISAVVPNTVKHGDFDWKSNSLLVKVPIDGVRTVSDLVNNIGIAAGLELYADPSYAARAVYLGGDPSTQHTAVELMQALAFCVCGTWRHVGPVYVLTDDLQGLGERQQFLADVVGSWSNRLQALYDSSNKKLYKFDWQTSLSSFPGDPIALPQDQLNAICTQDSKTDGITPWGGLPSALQTDAAQQINEQNSEDDPGDAESQAAVVASIPASTPIDVIRQINIALEIPGDGIMSFLQFLPDPPNEPDSGRQATTIAIPQKIRALLCAPKTADEARKTVDMLPSLGLNAIIVDVFNNGRAYFPNSAVPPETDEAGSVLSATIAEATIKHITVAAAIDTFCWRKDGDQPHPLPWPSTGDPDLNVFGEQSDVGARRRQEKNVVETFWEDTATNEQQASAAASEGWASPGDPNVGKALTGLVSALSKVSGVAAVIFQDTELPSAGDDTPYQIPLGYTLTNRLSWIRLQHGDPLDERTRRSELLFGGPGFGGFNFLVPSFHPRSASVQPWRKFLQNQEEGALKDCFAAAKAANPNLSLFMRERSDGVTLDPWTMAGGMDEKALNGFDDSYSYVNSSDLVTVPIAAMLTTENSLPPAVVEFEKDHDANNAGGIIFDLENGGISNDVPTMLNKLGPNMAPVH